MYIEQIYTNCLSQASYYLESDGEAIIIDPIRDSNLYLDLIKKRKTKVKYIFETHFHADFISGHLDLERLLGANIVFGANAETKYQSFKAPHEFVFELGQIKIKVLHTPGHTPESVCFLVYNEKGNQHCVFTGDTLFIGEVGRPDLAISTTITKFDLAGQLYDSLHNVLMKLDDTVIVYPGHGPGSACGKYFSKETISTIVEQKKNNYALQTMSKKDFIKLVLDGMLEPPPYFSHGAKMNREGYEKTSDIIQNNVKKFAIENLEKQILNGVIILDVRSGDDFEKGFIKGAIHVAKTFQLFATWVGATIPFDKDLIVVCYHGEEIEVISRLARVGYEKVLGVITDINQVDSRMKDKIISISPKNIFSSNLSDAIFLDVRKPSELKNFGTVPNSINIRLQELPNRLTELDNSKKYLIYCAGGYRSMIASSILKSNGFDSIFNIYGGFNSIKNFL